MSSLFKALRKGNGKHKRFDTASLIPGDVDCQIEIPKKELLEDWAVNKEPVIDGVTFYVKYLGSTLVENASGEESTADAIKTIVAMAKAGNKKLERVALTVSLRGIKMIDMATEETHLEISIYRISYCSADATYDHVFAFIATNRNETMECHAFICPKRKMAQAVTLTIAQAFNLAYEFWTLAKEKQKENKAQNSQSEDSIENGDSELTSSGYHSKLSSEVGDSQESQGQSSSLLIDLDGESNTNNVPVVTESPPENGKSWVCFEEDDFTNLNDSFTRLAAGRRHPMLDSPHPHLSNGDLDLAQFTEMGSSPGSLMTHGGTSGWDEKFLSRSPTDDLLCL